MAEVKIIKLITGEELLTELWDNPISDKIKIKNPVRIVVMPNKLDPKNPSIGFAPWAEFSDDKEFVLDKSHIVTIMKPIRQFADQYTSMFSSIIMNPNGQGLVIPGA